MYVSHDHSLPLISSCQSYSASLFRDGSSHGEHPSCSPMMHHCLICSFFLSLLLRGAHEKGPILQLGIVTGMYVTGWVGPSRSRAGAGQVLGRWPCRWPCRCWAGTGQMLSRCHAGAGHLTRVRFSAQGSHGAYSRHVREEAR